LGVGGTWDSSTKTASVAGALAEVVSMLVSANVYYDNDGVNGFKWDLTAAPANRYDIFNCGQAKTKGYDCLDPNAHIDLKDLTWTPITHAKVKCSTQIPDAPDSCEIHTLSTTGSNGTDVITFVARLATQRVLINSVLHGPDFAKFDVTVTFPYDKFSLYDATTAKLALISLNAGKSGTFVGTAQKNSDGSDSLMFSSAAGQSSHYSYVATAKVTVGTADSTESVTTQIITGQQLIDFDCPVGAPCLLTGTQALVGLYLKPLVQWLQLLSWKSSITVHSLGTSVKPTKVFWDPEVGAGTTTPSANSAAFAVPSVAFLAALLLL